MNFVCSFIVIKETLSDELNICVKDSRGQTYDNASNMSSTFSGVQVQVIAVNEKAVYIQCMTRVRIPESTSSA